MGCGERRVNVNVLCESDAPETLTITITITVTITITNNDNDERKTKNVRATPGLCGPKTFVVVVLLPLVHDQSGTNPGLPEKRFPPWTKGPVCHPDVRCVKTRRIGSRSNVYTNALPPLRALPAVGYARLSVSV